MKTFLDVRVLETFMVNSTTPHLSKLVRKRRILNYFSNKHVGLYSVPMFNRFIALGEVVQFSLDSHKSKYQKQTKIHQNRSKVPETKLA